MTEINKERIFAVAAKIEGLPFVSGFSHEAEADDVVGFCMADYNYDCGTPQCIAGWADYLYPNCSGHESVHDRATEVLGLNAVQALNLFVVFNAPGLRRLEDLSPTQAAATLRRLAETGEVKWDV